MKTIPLLVLLIAIGSAFGQESRRTLYKAQLLRAAPGKLLSLIELFKNSTSTFEESGDTAPFMIRHSQGDQWDLLLLYPMESYGDFYAADRIKRRTAAQAKQPGLTDQMLSYVVRQDEVFARGPALDVVRKCFESNRFFHVEMFRALAGKHKELVQEREMENAYLKILHRPENLIFVRDQGAGWDSFTIGCYRDIKHFAESADLPADAEEKAAVQAGFEAANRIGTYLRTLILEHHDTLAVAVP